MKLSVIVPVYNEQETIQAVLNKLLKVKAVNEVVVVNDGSTDLTKKRLARIKHRKLKILHKKNGGKGSAICAGLNKVTGDYVMIQDADLEYDPEDIPGLLAPVTKKKAQVVFGSRFLGPHSNLLFWHRKGNDLLNFIVNILYDTTLSDMETCYKLMPTKLLRQLNINCQKFDIEPEITCKLLLRGYNIYEVPISYVGRDFSQGKKITWRDGIDALKVILRLRLYSERG
jgi:glycosyltransferase involved in cell wall biosynthesis